MIVINAERFKREFFFENEIPENKIVDKKLYEISFHDVGKYYKLTDGSNWYVRILDVKNNYVATTGGLLFKADYMTLVFMEHNKRYYTGYNDNNLHFLIRPPKPVEIRFANELASGFYPFANQYTKRKVVLAFEELRKAAEAKGIDANFILDRLLREVDNENGSIKERIAVLGIISKIVNIDMPLSGSGISNAKQPLININNIQSEKRLIQQASGINEILAKHVEAQSQEMLEEVIQPENLKGEYEVPKEIINAEMDTKSSKTNES